MLQWRFANNLMLNAQAKPWCFPFQVMTPGDNKWADALFRWEHITFRDVNSARFCSVDLKETSCSFFLRQQSRWLNKRDFFHCCILVSIKSISVLRGPAAISVCKPKVGLERTIWVTASSFWVIQPLETHGLQAMLTQAPLRHPNLTAKPQKPQLKREEYQRKKTRVMESFSNSLDPCKSIKYWIKLLDDPSRQP